MVHMIKAKSDAANCPQMPSTKNVSPTTSEIYGGSGLGLNICRKLVRLHGGDIGVRSNEGGGATISFFFRVRQTGSSTDDRPSERNKD
jgi:K+-sensing histidine kinase KdpD